ncbi:MAG: DUF11 domain-containing protein [Pseudomonadota bacterium]
MRLSTALLRAGRLILFLLGFTAAAAVAQTTTYSEDFVSGTSYDPGETQVDNWEAFRDSLTATYSNITVGGSEGPSVSCSDLAAVAAITSALNTDSAASISCEGRDWNIGTCVGTNELSIDEDICTCQAASPFTLRPDIDAGNAAWGGIGATCGPGFSGVGANVDQTLTVSVDALGAPTDADLSLAILPAMAGPTIGANTFIDIEVQNVGPADATGVAVDFLLPAGLSYVSDDSGGTYNDSTGVWTVGSITAGATERLRIIVQVLPSGSYVLTGEISSSDQNDNDSTPGNASSVPGEDDDDRQTLVPVSAPPPDFCLGRPVQFLSFVSPVRESGTGTLASPDVGDVYRFGNVAPGFDALVTLTDLSAGTSIGNIDNEVDGFAPGFQPTLNTTGAGSATFDIQIVRTGTSVASELDFSVSGVDIDGGAGLFEYVEVSNNFVESALNSVQDITEDSSAAPIGFTRFISNDPTPAGAAGDPSGFPPPDDTEADFPIVDGISLAPPHIFTAFYTDVSTFTYRIGSTAATGGAGRLNSLLFNCPNINASVSSVVAEDFGDAPFDPVSNPGYGNPIHVIDPADPVVQLGASNTAEASAGNDPAANSDAGDDGVTVGGASLQGATFQGLESETVTIAVANASGSAGFLQAFFDWNIDGDFEDAGEQVALNVQDADGDGTIVLPVTPPAGTVAGNSFARFRWATSSVGFQAAASDGEVEDYQIALTAAEPSDVSLAIAATPNSIGVGAAVTLTVTITNDGPADATGVVASIPLPPELSFVSSDAGADYDETTGMWTLLSALANGASITLTIQTTANSIGTALVSGEITVADRPDPDSTPNNATSAPGEDDSDVVAITINSAPPVCPAGLNLVNTGGNAVAVASQTSITNADFALGALSAAGTTPPDPVAAFLNLGVSSVMVLDLGVVVPENGQLVFSLARDDDQAINNTMLEIRASLNSTSFPSVFGVYRTDPTSELVATAPQNTIEHITISAPVGGVQFLRFDILTGDSAFVDGVSFSQSCLSDGQLEAAKTVTVFDPLDEGLYAIPGNDVTYTISVRNVGGGPTDADSIFMVDELPSEVIFFNGDADGPGPGTDPVNFEDVVPTGLDPFVFADSVRFAGAGSRPADFASCNLVADPGLDEDVRYVCFNPQGIMNSGNPDPEFSLSFRARVR